MAALVTENFDGVTAPSLPSGWTFNGSWATQAAAPKSSPNSLINNDSGTVSYASYNTIATSTDATVDAWFLTGSLVTSVNLTTYVCARMNSQTYAGSSGYLAGLQLGTLDSPFGLVLYKRVSGTLTQLGSTINPAGDPFAINVYYDVQLVCAGTSIIVRCQRNSDSKFLTSAGTWQVGTADAISVTDSAVTAAGYVGIIQFIAGTLTDFRADDFTATQGSSSLSFTTATSSAWTGSVPSMGGSGSASFITATSSSWTASVPGLSQPGVIALPTAVAQWTVGAPTIAGSGSAGITTLVPFTWTVRSPSMTGGIQGIGGFMLWGNAVDFIKD